MSEQPLEQLSTELKKGIVSLDDFTFESKIGKGGFGEVWKAIHKKTGTICAIKKLFLNQENANDESIQMFIREVQALYKCKYLFLLRLLGFSAKVPYFIVTPFINNGSLWDYVCSSSTKPPISPTNLTMIAIGVSYALMKLHSINLVHRDLKSPNILLDEKLLPYICDFGIAKATNDATHMTQDIGTTYWMSPEQMNSDSYTNKVDVYSFGSILYEMVAHKYPFEGYKSIKVAMAISSGKRPRLPETNKQICSIIQCCWKQNPEERPSMEQILKLFIQGKAQFDGTQKRGVDAMIHIISNADPEFAQKIVRWTSKPQSIPQGESRDHHHHHHHDHGPRPSTL